MDIAAAKHAGELALAIEARTEMRAFVQTAITEGWRVVDVVAQNPATGERKSLILKDLDDASSQAGLGFIDQMYATQLETLNAELTSL